MSVRKVSNRGGNIIGKFPSFKMKRAIQFESTLERDYLYLLDYAADVTFFEEQPLLVEYQHDGKARRYTPDFHIVQCGRNILAECKPAALVNTDENQRKFAAARQLCDARGWEFKIVTDAELRSGFRLSNVKLLWRYAGYAVRPEMKGRIHALVQSAPTPLTIGQIQAVFPQPAVALVCLMHMAFHHEVAISLDNEMISACSLVRAPGQAVPGEQL